MTHSFDGVDSKMCRDIKLSVRKDSLADRILDGGEMFTDSEGE